MSADQNDQPTETETPKNTLDFAKPSEWVGQAEAYARREPMKAVGSAVGAGFLLNFLPIRAILGALIAVAFALARPLILFLGLLKVWEMCPCKKDAKI